MPPVRSASYGHVENDSEKEKPDFPEIEEMGKMEKRFLLH